MIETLLKNDLVIMRALQLLLVAAGRTAVALEGRITETEATLAVAATHREAAIAAAPSREAPKYG